MAAEIIMTEAKPNIKKSERDQQCTICKLNLSLKQNRWMLFNRKGSLWFAFGFFFPFFAFFVSHKNIEAIFISHLGKSEKNQPAVVMDQDSDMLREN